MRTVLFVLVDRANYGRLKPLMAAANSDTGLRVLAVCAGSMVLNRFKRPVDIVRKDGFEVAEELYISLEGSTPATMTRGIGVAVGEFVGCFERIDPDVVVIIGDRFEALGAAIAAAYTRRCILHLQGGEVSGSLDELTRHAITKLSHWHAPATERAAANIRQLGEDPYSIVSVGCPVSDVALRIQASRGESVLCVYHPDTNCPEAAAGEMLSLLRALDSVGRNTILLWPNIDAGSDAVSKAIRRFRDQHGGDWLNVATNFEPEAYLELLACAAACVGNSSSFVRDAGFFGTPVVLVGERQAGRECGPNVQYCGDTDNLANRIASAVRKQRYEPSAIYGDGRVCQRIVPHLHTIEWYAKKFHENHWHHTCARGQQGDTQEESGGDCREVPARTRG